MQPQPSSKFQFDLALFVAATATIIGAWLRLAIASDLDFSGDEFYTLRWAVRPVEDLLSTYGTGANTTPYYALFMKGWLYFFGPSPLAMKFPSLMAGIALIPCTFWLGRHWLDAETGSLAAMMVAFSMMLFAWSRTARVYAILTLLVMVAMLLFLRALRRGSRSDYFWLGLVNGALVILWLTSMYILMVQVVVLILERLYRPRLPWRRLLGFAASYALSVVLTILLYLKMIPSILSLMGVWGGSSFFRFESFINVFKFHHPGATIFILGCLAYGVWVAWRRGDTVGRLLVLWAVLPMCYYVLTRTKFPDHTLARFLIPTLPAHLLLISMGLLTALRRLFPEFKPRWHLAVGLAVVIGIFVMNPQRRSAPFREALPIHRAVSRIQEIAQPGDLVTSSPGSYLEVVKLYPQLESIPWGRLMTTSNQPAMGRLIILTPPFPKAEARWSNYFEIEQVGGLPYRRKLSILRSLPDTTDTLLEPVRQFLLGYVDGAEQGARLHTIPRRHHQRLAQTHRSLSNLARRAGDEHAYEEHRRLMEYHQQRQAVEGEKIR